MAINVDEVYAGDNMNAAYVKANGPFTLRIAGVEVKVFENDDGTVGDKKLVLHFEGEKKGLALNVTNKNACRDAWGPIADEWVGRRLLIQTGRTSYMGKPCDGVFVEPTTDVAAANGGNGAGAVTPMGTNAAGKLAARLQADGLRLDDLRGHLSTLGFACSGEPQAWPAAWMGAIKGWLDNPTIPTPPDDDIPF